MSIMHNDIVEEFPLRKLAKDDSFEQTCRAFVQAMKVGICVMDDQGNVVSDVRRDNEHHCQLFNQTHEGRRHCSEVLDQVRCSKFDSHEEWREISCLSGLVYWVSPIVFGGESLGISILGPLKPWPKRPSAPRRLEILGEEFDLQTGDAASLMIQITQPADETLKVWSGFLDSFLNLYFRLHLTSQLHLATMDAAYSDLKLRNEALENSNAKLSELDQSKSNFIATISHELKTPLTSIIGYAEMLSEGLVGPIRDEQKRPLNTILEKGEHLLELIEQLLDLAKSDVRDSRFESTEIIIKTWLDRSLSDVRPQAERKKLILIREEDPAVPVWHGDFRRLRRVLTNLLSNAVKFTPEGGHVTVRTRVEAKASDDIFAVSDEPVLVLEVEDSGIGMLAEDLERIFEAFVQVDNSATREVGGTGLGLVIVKKFVEEHGGSVSVSSTPGSGTMFRCSFPASRLAKTAPGEL